MFTLKLIKNVDSTEEIVILRESPKVTIHQNKEIFLQNLDNKNVFSSLKFGEDFDIAYIMNSTGATISKI